MDIRDQTRGEKCPLHHKTLTAPRQASSTAWTSLQLLELFLNKLLKERYASIDLKTEQVIRQLVNIAFLDQGDMFNDDGTFKAVHEMPDYVRRAIDSICK